MTNLWGVLLQTCSVSLVAGLLLGLKRVWKQTLSPRWQSALWGILAVRILFPVTMTGKFLLLPLPFWVETLKTVVEGHPKQVVKDFLIKFTEKPQKKCQEALSCS